MKNILLLTLITITSSFCFAQNYDYSETEIKEVFGEILRSAGKYTLMEMRPSATINSARILMVKNDSQENGGDIKARIEVKWTTLFTLRSRTHVNDVWLSIEGNNVYFTRYKLYTDDHNIVILNRHDVKMKKLAGSFGDSSNVNTNDF